MKTTMKIMGLVFSTLALGTVLTRGDQPVASAPVAAPAPQNLAPAPAQVGNPFINLTAEPAKPEATDAAGGKIQFEMPNYDFGKSKAGEPIKYSFVFTNTGAELLEIKNVKPGCGCTAAGEWTRKVQPGQTGSIPIQVNITASWPNGPVAKYVDVDSSDKTQPTMRLNIRGVIWKPIEANPQVAMLNNVPAEAPETVSSIVTITNNTDEFVTVLSAESNNKSFTTTIKTNTPGKSYQLVVNAVPPLTAGSVQAQITIKTSSTNMPALSVTAYATVVAPISVMPAQITLQFAPITTKLTPSVTIKNNGTNLITLSEPSVNAKDVEVQINEAEPGRTFVVSLKIPEGFEVPKGEKIELSLKSSHPQFPVIKLPIIQLQRPTPPVIAPSLQIKPGVPIKPGPAAALAQPTSPTPAGK